MAAYPGVHGLPHDLQTDHMNHGLPHDMNHGLPHDLQTDHMNHHVNYGPPPSASSESKSPLNLNFLRSLQSEKKQTKDGQPPKRRGPKPDSKPALTRRQELNRQAQRTHRERKEMYIKALEQEVLRLKELYTATSRERDQFADENRRLKQLLLQHGISYDFGETPIKFNRENSNYGPSSSGSISGSYRGASDSTGFSPPPSSMTSGRAAAPPVPNMPPRQAGPARNMAPIPTNRLDYDQIGIDFVLTLERPCMDHMQYLMVRSHNPEGQPFHHPMERPDDSEHDHMSGHALMASGAPYSHIMHKPAEKYPHQMPAELDNNSLSKLLSLSSRLPLDREGEITPVMAWSMMFQHDRVREIDKVDFEKIKVDLSTKVRCYGFGAVLEEFEVVDALGKMFAEKDANHHAMPGLDAKVFTQQISVH